MKKTTLAIIATWLLVTGLQAARIDSLYVNSPKMERDIPVVVVVPEQAVSGQKCPVLYLLHGHTGNEKSWLALKPELPQMADEAGILVVCPDGENSWYWDSPTRPDSQFETFVASELIDFIDTHYPTIADRKGRAVAGLSMGGHGAMYLSTRHKSVFGVAGSMSGGLDIRPFPNNWNMKDQLEEETANQDRWNKHAAITQLDSIQNGDLALIIDCGRDDFFLEVNKNFHEALDQRKINHDFIIRPGSHNGEYWNNSIDYQWLFFKKFFNGYRSPQQ